MAGDWIDPRTGSGLDGDAAFARLAEARVVLLGERHDSARDHRWQAATIAGLAARRPQVVVGLEMVARTAQPALDGWVAGRLDRDAFLDESRWLADWGFDPALYAPILDLCRESGLRMRGLNIPRDLVRAIGRDGWDAVPASERGWLTPAAPATQAYRRYLFEMTGGQRPGRAALSPEDPAFDRFVRAQQAWDRAFACAIAEALDTAPEALVVGVIGRGHLEFGHGTPAQLTDLGIAPVRVALPGMETGPGTGTVADLVCKSP
jgi:uncharacterized iron-regulated protein